MNKETLDNNLYINSGVYWLGDIPSNWNMIPNKYLFKEMTKKVGSKWEQTQLLSLTTNGIKEKGFDEIGGKMPESYDNYLEVRKGQLVMCLFDLDVSAVFSGLSPYDGMITSAYHVYEGSDKIDMRYVDYFFKFVFDNRNYKLYSKSLRYTISSDGFNNIKTPVPPLGEQKRIADFIDYKCNQIDDIIDGLKQKSDSLQEYKKAITKELVTKGINNTNFIDSGIHWIGTIPENWNMIPNKYLFKEMTKKVGSKWEQTQLLSLTTNGIKEKGFDEIGGKMPESYDNYLEVRKGQLVMCLFDLDVSAVFSGLSPYDGMITSAYHVYEGSDKIDMRYVDYFFKFVFDNRNYKLYSKSLRYTISSDGFNNIKTPVPPLGEQKQIADYLDDQYKKINDISDGIKEEIRILEDYKKSLIYEYVTGKKVVKDE